MNEIQDIFSNSNCLDSFYDNLNLTYAPTDTVNAQVESLSEIFTEWYLFDSSHEKNIQQFLDEEELNDIFTELEFMDLMCGNAYVDNEILQFIEMKLPFRITSDKLYTLNQSIQTKDCTTYIIPSKPNLIAIISNLFHLKEVKNKEHKFQVKHAYYLKNKKHIQQLKRAYYLQNQTSIKTRSKKYYANNKSKIQEYYANNQEHRQKLHHDNYMANKEAYNIRSKAYYAANKEKQKEYLKTYYEKTKEDRAMAKTMCAAYIFILKFRMEHEDKYLELYRAHQDPLKHMMKKCPALQNKDINMCPLCNDKCESSLTQICNQKILSVPGTFKELQTIAKDLKQR